MEPVSLGKFKVVERWPLRQVLLIAVLQAKILGPKVSITGMKRSTVVFAVGCYGDSNIIHTQVGERVVVNGNVGIVRFTGITKFAPGYVTPS